MHPLQAMMNAISDAALDTRSNYHVTLGKMIERAKQARGIVRFADGGFPGNETSYRGYYSDLAFVPQEEPKSVSAFLAQCNGALGNTYYGYKGGDFVMSADTPLWRAEYGSTGDAIVRAVIGENGDLILHCLPEDE